MIWKNMHHHEYRRMIWALNNIILQIIRLFEHELLKWSYDKFVVHSRPCTITISILLTQTIKEQKKSCVNKVVSRFIHSITETRRPLTTDHWPGLYLPEFDPTKWVWIAWAAERNSLDRHMGRSSMTSARGNGCWLLVWIVYCLN